MKKQILGMAFLTCILVFVIGCDLFGPEDPILLNETFESGEIPDNIWTWQTDSLYTPVVIDDNGNKVLKLSSSSDSISQQESQPHYSGFGFNGGPNERPLNTSWTYTISYDMKVIQNEVGWSSLTFRYYGDSFDDRTTFSIFSGLNTSIRSFKTNSQNDLEPTLTENQWVNIKINLFPSKYSVYINDSLVFEESDSPTPMSNATWEVLGGLEVYFDNISIIRTDIE
jgi:hypothetical protein